MTDTGRRATCEDASALEAIKGEPDRPLLLVGATVRTGDPVIGDFEKGDLLLGAGSVVGVGTGLVTSAGDDGSLVIDCSGRTIVPLVVDTLAMAGRRPDRASVQGSLRPGNPATFAIVGGKQSLRDASRLLVDQPDEVVGVLDAGTPVRWNSSWLVEPPSGDQREQPTTNGEDRIGVWVDDTGFLEQELTSAGRYDETRGGRPHAYQGAYWIARSDRIDYLDDLGFWAFGEFDGDILRHAGYTLRKR